MLFSFPKYSFINWWHFIFYLTLIVYAAGSIVVIMEPDAASYADVSMEMVHRKNYFEIYLRGNDWLDKPHFQFWATALSFKIFGINTFSYKFPAIVFSLIAIWYTFRFTQIFYSPKHAYISALILMTAQHFILSNNDVRAEPYLAALTIFSMYYFAIFLDTRKFWYLIIGSAGLGGLLMTKGLFTVIPVASAVAISLVYEKRWKDLFHWQWFAVIFFTLLFTLPTLVGYYFQFDLQPEKEIFGQTGVSGVRFFLWDSQWGRFNNSGPIKGQGDYFFFIHTMLWAFAPWAFVGYLGIFKKTKALIRNISSNENYTYFGFIFLFIIFSLSKFQLPHYLNQLFPFIAILASSGLVSLENNLRGLKILYVLQLITICCFIIILFTLHYLYFNSIPEIDVSIVMIFCFGLAFWIIWSEKDYLHKILFPAALVILSINYYLNRQFYPDLLKYQSESEVAFYIRSNEIEHEKIICFDKNQWISDFYLKQVVPFYSKEQINQIDFKNCLIYTSEEGKNFLSSSNIKFSIIKSFEDFHVTTLNADFINKRKRGNTLQTNYLLKAEN